ncbi:hypothetical protein Fcan01_11792 [Folsomia candida]|uniref:Uncharacterized protein n=1 Tax=Folsomia candida TaxID=158441 RepID=A0A226E7H4_FOLCA|nr:hypothetical protein Fcan01_11792 [Folsomia candida]
MLGMSILSLPNYTVRNSIIVSSPGGITSFILLSLYETFLTGKLIAPSSPAKYRHVGDLVNAGAICFIDRLKNFSLQKSETDPAIVREFRKRGVLQKINCTFFYASLNNDSLPIDKVSMYVSEAPTGNRDMSQVYKMIMINTTQPEFQRGDRFYCDFVTLVGLMHELFQYDVRLMGEMVKIHRRLMPVDWCIIGTRTSGIIDSLN